MNINSKVIYGIFIIAVIFFIVTVSILGFSKCSEDPLPKLYCNPLRS